MFHEKVENEGRWCEEKGPNNNEENPHLLTLNNKGAGKKVYINPT